MGRVDGPRTGRATSALPGEPRLLWRAVTHGGLDRVPLAVASDGSVIVASASLPEMTQLSRDGRELSHSSTGAGPAVTGPVLLSDATRVVVTSAGEAVGFWPGGSLRFRTDLGLPGRSARIAPLALDDGGVAIAVATEVLQIDADGTVVGRATVGDRIVGALVHTALGTVATTDNGSAFVIRGGHATRIGSLGGDPGPGAAATNPRTIVAVVDNRRLVALDLQTSVLTTLHNAADGVPRWAGHGRQFQRALGHYLLRGAADVRSRQSRAAADDPRLHSPPAHE